MPRPNCCTAKHTDSFGKNVSTKERVFGTQVEDFVSVLACARLHDVCVCVHARI